jgi:hypothetical protein
LVAGLVVGWLEQPELVREVVIGDALVELVEVVVDMLGEEPHVLDPGIEGAGAVEVYHVSHSQPDSEQVVLE